MLDPAFYVDPWDGYAWLRDEAPVYRDPAQQLWAISRYDDVLAIEKDGATYSSFYGSRPHLDQRADESMINMFEPTADFGHKVMVIGSVVGLVEVVLAYELIARSQVGEKSS